MTGAAAAFVPPDYAPCVLHHARLFSVFILLFSYVCAVYHVSA
jgi:hypothetical protein